MTHKVYVVTDLGPGDGGKGTVVHKVATVMAAHTIIKEGGGQGQHGVTNSRGERCAFSHWGCGTLEGIRTHISSRMVISPVGIFYEGNRLRFEHGLHNADDLLTIDERALCATQYHGIASRLKEMARGANPRGTIGTGIGEAYRDAQKYPNLIIRAGDLKRPDIKERLAAAREQIRRDLGETVKAYFSPEDREEAASEIDLLSDDEFLELAAERFGEVARRARIVDSDYLRREVLAKEGVAVVESSHGVLTDHYHGFYPHVSAIRTLPCFRQAMLREAGFDGQIVNIGVRRAYEIRHGAGPMPTEDPAMAGNLLPGSHKVENRYQGKVRVGPLDLVLLRYAIEVCGGPGAFDGLAITWFDQIQKNGIWHLNDGYQDYRMPDNRPYFSPSGDIKVRRGHDDRQLEYQEALGERLKKCVPRGLTYEIPPGATCEELFALCAGVLQEKTGVPVRLVSFGPTELDKVCK